MINQHQLPVYNNSNNPLPPAGKTQSPKAQVLNPNASQTNKWPSIKKTAAALSIAGFGAIYLAKSLQGKPVILDPNNSIPPSPQPSSSLGIATGCFLAIGIPLAAYAAYHKFGKPTPSTSKQSSSTTSKPLNTASTTKKEIPQQPIKPFQATTKKISSPTLPAATNSDTASKTDSQTTSKQVSSTPLVTRDSHTVPETNTSPTSSPKKPFKNKPANSWMGQNPRANLEAAYTITTDDRFRENKEKEEEIKSGLGQLSQRDLRKKPDAWRRVNPLDNLDVGYTLTLDDKMKLAQEEKEKRIEELKKLSPEAKRKNAEALFMFNPIENLDVAHTVTLAEKMREENEKIEKLIIELKKLPKEELRKHPAAWLLLDPFENLNALKDDPDYQKMSWMEEFSGILNPTKLSELLKILTEKIDPKNCPEENFKFYAKKPHFWILITLPQLKKEAVKLLSPKLIEILVSEVMLDPNNRIDMLNAILGAVSDEDNNECKKLKLMEIAKCGHENLDKFLLELAASYVDAAEEIMQIRKEAVTAFNRKYKSINNTASLESQEQTHVLSIQ